MTNLMNCAKLSDEPTSIKNIFNKCNECIGGKNLEDINNGLYELYDKILDSKMMLIYI
uniref:Uncharacterized protein n=1 Tax=Rhizophagus irregularis (strain DAOM 181602 / DAOM 197198 / MUCL 43194) TaxID=747089 RepID=U9SZ44_RHIID